MRHHFIYKGNSGVCMSDKQGRAGVVTLAFPGHYLLAVPHEFLDQSDGFFLSVVTNRAGQGQGG
jgi:hypothetical protein